MLAGLIFPVVDEELLFEIPWFAVLVEEVSEGGATLGDGFAEHGLDFVGELFESGFGDAPCLSTGMDATAEEGFTCVDVTHSDDDLAVHDVLFDRGFASLAGLL